MSVFDALFRSSTDGSQQSGAASSGRDNDCVPAQTTWPDAILADWWPLLLAGACIALLL